MHQMNLLYHPAMGPDIEWISYYCELSVAAACSLYKFNL